VRVVVKKTTGDRKEISKKKGKRRKDKEKIKKDSNDLFDKLS